MCLISAPDHKACGLPQGGQGVPGEGVPQGFVSPAVAAGLGHWGASVQLCFLLRKQHRVPESFWLIPGKKSGVATLFTKPFGCV